MKIREQDILNVIIDYLAGLERDGKLFYFRSASGGVKMASGGFFRTGRAGVPDITVLCNGRYIGLEVKTPTGKQQDSQKEIETLIQKHGGEYHLVRGVSDVAVILIKALGV